MKWRHSLCQSWPFHLFFSLVVVVVVSNNLSELSGRKKCALRHFSGYEPYRQRRAAPGEWMRFRRVVMSRGTTKWFSQTAIFLSCLWPELPVFFSYVFFFFLRSRDRLVSVGGTCWTWFWHYLQLMDWLIIALWWWFDTCTYPLGLVNFCNSPHLLHFFFINFEEGYLWKEEMDFEELHKCLGTLF